jgi:single-strand DNA-binding protein
MAILTGLARLGRDATLRHTPQGDAVLEMALAYNYGQKDAEGKRPTQWIEATLWGKRAEALAPHLTKGSAIDVVITELHIETWVKKDQTTGVKLVGKVSEIEFAGGGDRKSEGSTSASKPAPAKPQQSGGFGDPDDDMPF